MCEKWGPSLHFKTCLWSSGMLQKTQDTGSTLLGSFPDHPRLFLPCDTANKHLASHAFIDSARSLKFIWAHIHVYSAKHLSRHWTRTTTSHFFRKKERILGVPLFPIHTLTPSTHPFFSSPTTLITFSWVTFPQIKAPALSWWLGCWFPNQTWAPEPGL